jgi:hypothetical protein
MKFIGGLERSKWKLPVCQVASECNNCVDTKLHTTEPRFSEIGEQSVPKQY